MCETLPPSPGQTTGEPIYITNKGKGVAEGVFMSVEAFEQREKLLDHRASIPEAEFSRLAGAQTCSMDEVRARQKENDKTDSPV